MPKPDYIICLECESEVDEFAWRDGEIRKATCDVCGNNDTDSFALPEEYEQGFEDDDSEDEDEEDEEEYLDDYDDYQEEAEDV